MASKFMDANDIVVSERVPASRKLGRDEAEGLAGQARRLVIARARKLQVIEPGGKPDKETVTSMLGSTGNLRAPTIKVGKTVLVGFNEDEYRQALLQ